MAKKVVVTEKPSVARQFASALHVSGSHEGYIENDEWIITWCVGHLITLSYPEKYDESLKKWSLSSLPFLPPKYKYEVLAQTKKQFQIVKSILNRSDVSTIYNCGDSGREGEYIQRLVYTAAGVEGKKEIKRVWIDSQTDAEILRGIREAKPEAAYNNLSAAAYERAIEDYAVGINLSRALSCKFGYQFNKEISTLKKNDKYVPLAVGRVMTCVLAMIVDRENEIRNFVPSDYFKIDADHGGFTSHWKPVEGTPYFGSDKLYNENGFSKEDDASALLSDLQKDPSLKVLSCTSKDSKKEAPLLYNLAELQSDCSKIFKISPDETLQVAQSLYEKKLTTYPRTDARVLSTPVAIEITKNVVGAGAISGMEPIVKKITGNGWIKGIEKTKYTDDKKITDHHAIIPTGEGSLSGLSKLEEDVYLLICRRFFSIFFPAAIYKQQKAELVHTNGEHFFASSKVLTSPGYMEVSGTSAAEDSEVTEKGLNLTPGIKIRADFKVVKSTTQPPKRYTSGSMILAMENAGKLIEDAELREQIKGAGIGTSATRAETIKKLTENGYISLQKKTQVLTPTGIGEAVYKYVQMTVPSMLSPRMTASWEKGLSQIEDGSLLAPRYRATMEKFVTDSVNLIKSKEAETYTGAVKKVSGTCPICGKDLYESEKMYWCSGYKKDDPKACQFGFSKVTCGAALSPTEISSLLSGRSTDYRSDFVSKKTGKPFTARLKVTDTGKVDLEMKPRDTAGSCPNCGSELYMSPTGGYWCSAHKKDDPSSCQFMFNTRINGISIGEENVNRLLSGEGTRMIPNLKSKTGKTFEAYFAIGKNGKVEMRFPTETSSMRCPSCGEYMQAGRLTYECGCGVKFPRMMAKREFSQEEINTLYSEGRMDGLTKFHKKDGGTFSADITYDATTGTCAFDFGDSKKKKAGSGKKGRKKS